MPTSRSPGDQHSLDSVIRCQQAHERWRLWLSHRLSLIVPTPFHVVISPRRHTLQAVKLIGKRSRGAILGTIGLGGGKDRQSGAEMHENSHSAGPFPSASRFNQQHPPSTLPFNPKLSGANNLSVAPRNPAGVESSVSRAGLPSRPQELPRSHAR